MLNASDLEGTWKCDDGGTYFIRNVGKKLVIIGTKVVYENFGIGEIDEQNNEIHVDWQDSKKSKGAKKAKNLQSSVLQIKDTGELKSDGTNKDFQMYGNFTRVE